MIKLQLINTGLLSLFFCALTFSAYTDISKGKIYNWVSYPAVILGFAFRFFSGWPDNCTAGLVSSFLGAFLGFILLFVFFVVGGIGAGDVKLMTAIGAFGGWYFLIWTFYFSAIVGGFAAIFVLIYKGQLWSGLKRTFLFFKNIFFPFGEKVTLVHENAITIPFGVVIVAATYLTFFLKGV